MTKEKSFKRRVRERMSTTGETYTAARGQVAPKRDRVEAARARLAVTDRPADEKVEAVTGRTWDAWFSVLDAWEAQQRKHGEIAAYLVEQHGVPGWWAQSITVYYERARGLRLKHQQADGFSVSASKTVAVALDVLFDAVLNPRARRKWLTDATMTLRTSQAGQTARFTWGDGATRVNVFFTAKGPDKATVTVIHERLPDPDEAETAKALWRERLVALKSHLER
jgi:hypothetical protein